MITTPTKLSANCLSNTNAPEGGSVEATMSHLTESQRSGLNRRPLHTTRGRAGSISLAFRNLAHRIAARKSANRAQTAPESVCKLSAAPSPLDRVYAGPWALVGRWAI